jgi:hypothetical protein
VRALSLGLTLSIGISGLCGARASGANEKSVLVVVNDYAHVQPLILDLAAKETARIYWQADVKIRWRLTKDALSATFPDDHLESHNSFVVRLIIQPKLRAEPRRPSSSLMGAAPPSPHACSAVVYLFFDQIMKLSNAERLNPALVLGTAAAHEVGHALLRRGAHSSEGLMRPLWTPDDWRRAALGLLLFSRSEREAVHRTLTSCRD